jgi:hypothetical protein
VEEPLLEEEPLALGSQLAEEDTDPVALAVPVREGAPVAVVAPDAEPVWEPEVDAVADIVADIVADVVEDPEAENELRALPESVSDPDPVPLPVEEPLPVLEEEPLALGSQLAEEDTDPVPVPLAVAVCAGLDEDRELAVAEGDAVPEADAEALGVQPTPLNTPTISTVEPNSARRLCAACWAAPGPGGAAGTKSTMASRRRSLGGEDSGLGREEKPEVEAAWGGKGPMVGLRAEASKVCEKEPCKPI